MTSRAASTSDLKAGSVLGSGVLGIPLAACGRELPQRLNDLVPFVEATGPLALCTVVTQGAPDSRTSQILELALVLLNAPDVSNARWVTLNWGSSGEPDLQVLKALATELSQRTWVVHDVTAVRPFLSRSVSPGLAKARALDTLDLVSVAHPDAASFGLEALTLPLLDRPPATSAEGMAMDLLEVLVAIAAGQLARRYAAAARALDRFVSTTPWRALIPDGFDDLDQEAPGQFLEIGETREAPVPFDADAIAAVLLDEERGRRHFDHYRARPEQVELMRAFARNLGEGGSLLLEGGTGVGKSLAYLAAAIPFAVQRAEAGERDPVLLSTRTKLLQDQLLEKDIAAAARMLGYPQLQALSIKGRANYICEKRLQEVLTRGADTEILTEDRMAFATLLGCARNRGAGEVGSLPSSLLARHAILRDLVHGSVAQRAEQCSREECAHQKRCPFGRRRAALSKAHLIVANHDLLLRWPPDYPRFGHVIADEGHELSGVADDVYAETVRPEELMERIDEVFGTPSSVPGREPARALLPRKQRLEAQKTVHQTRRALALDFAAIGRTISARAGDWGEVELPADAERAFPDAARCAEAAAGRLESLARLAEELDARAEWTFEETPTSPAEGPTPVEKNSMALRDAAGALRTAFGSDADEVVAAFDRLAVPYDRWVLALRPVSPAGAFHREFLESRKSFAAVSASLFVGGDAFAALGELELEERAAFGVDRLSIQSPFDYEGQMRVAALPDPTDADELVARTAEAIALLARLLGGRTLGLFTSLRRMRAVAERLEMTLEGEGIEVLWPDRTASDPASLVGRFRNAPGGAVLLGARTFWQGVDLPGDALQAVVIEKLPFEVPTELRRRREARIRDLGLNAFDRYRLGKMLLHLKQMGGRLIRGEADRGLVVIVESRSDRGYSRRLVEAFPPGVCIQPVSLTELPALAREVQLGVALNSDDSES
ncbi:MAG: ATP-dependent DNA helicase [Myxococcota bacterium]|nr:ATP-dependent DNA helicase [Myxococcota bacterium]